VASGSRMVPSESGEVLAKDPIDGHAIANLL
jgi:hypothetical protein